MRPTLRTLAFLAVLIGLVLNGTGLSTAFAFCHPKASACAPETCHASKTPCCCAPTAPPSDVGADLQPAAAEHGTLVVQILVEVVSSARARHACVRTSAPRLPDLRRVGRGRAPPVLSVSLS